MNVRLSIIPGFLVTLLVLFNGACGESRVDPNLEDLTLLDPATDGLSFDFNLDTRASPLRPCGDDRDCLGGELCIDGYCREVCSAERPCEGPLMCFGSALPPGTLILTPNAAPTTTQGAQPRSGRCSLEASGVTTTTMTAMVWLTTSQKSSIRYPTDQRSGASPRRTIT